MLSISSAASLRLIGPTPALMWHRMYSSLVFTGSKTVAPSREEVLKLIHKGVAGRLRTGLRRGWQVKAAAWVKKAHIDRGDKKVGLFATDGKFHIIEDLRPRYIVPDLSTTLLKPYVSHYQLGSTAPTPKAP